MRSSRSPRRSRFRTARLRAVGTDADVLKHKGPKTRVIDAGGKVVLPGLMDSHTHPTGAAMSEWKEPLARPAVAQGGVRLHPQADRDDAGRGVDRPALRVPDAAGRRAVPDQGGAGRGGTETPGPVPRGTGRDRQQHGAEGVGRDEGHAKSVGRRSREGPGDGRADRDDSERLRSA